MKNILFLVILAGAVALSGCGDSDRINQLIAEANANRAIAYAEGMAACGNNSGCQVGLTAVVAGGLGMQPFFKPETTLDYVKEARLWVDPVGNLIDRLNGGTGGVSGDRAASVIRGDGNLVLIGNRASADNGSTAGFSLNPSYVKSWSGYNRNFTGQQPITDEGLQ